MKNVYLVVSLLVFAIMVDAQVIQVPSEQSTIQAGIEAANDGDTVLVEEGTYMENIIFKGKAITVASQFILDGDTSHISKTVIDGSGYGDWRNGSTVLMKYGEDTTSVLMGFTISGGAGTLVTRGNWTVYYGAGINIMNSGGKIVNNIIEENHMTTKPGHERYLGGGINASVNHNHTAVIRDNIIRNNSVSADLTGGGGIAIDGGRAIVEHNTIKDNICQGNGASGGAIFWFDNGDEGTIEEVIIRNNSITGNQAISSGGYISYGGAIGTGLGFSEGIFKIYNNIISNNSVSGGAGGGFYNWSQRALVYNNTFHNNVSSQNGNNIGILNSEIIMYNNIIWSDVENGVSDVFIAEVASRPISVYNNVLKDSFNRKDLVRTLNNMYLDPELKPDSDELAENSLAIGRAVDSIYNYGIWYYAPSKDLAGNSRPNPIDQHADMGALESEFSPVPLSTTDLVNIILPGYSLNPDFHTDTLSYSAFIIDTITTHPVLAPIPEDPVALVEIQHAEDILSPDPDKRTTTITVTSSDGTNKKNYTIEFYALSTVNTLSSLEVEGYSLNLSFDPEVHAYNVGIPDTLTEAPVISAVAAHDKAEIDIDIDTISPEKLIAMILVIPEAGRPFHQPYFITFDLFGVGVSDSNSDNFIKLYPNPVSAVLSVQLNKPGRTEITITSLNGQQVYSSEMEATSYEIDLSAFQKGLYFITIRSKDFVTTRKIIKL
jgi:hypothetical protein